MAYQNFYTTKLYTDVSAADTTITLETPPTATSGRLVLEARNVSKREVIKYTGVSGNQVTGVLRGQGGTTAQTHLANTLVEMNLTAEDLEDAINVPNDIVTRFDESLDDFIASGLVWSQTALLVGEMTAGVVYIDGERLVIGALSGINFTASRDTYVDVGVDGVVDYDPVANGASAPALAGSHVRIAKVVTNGSGITSVTALSAAGPIKQSNPYKFRAYRNGNYSFATGTNKVSLNAETYDTNNNFDSTTNFRYTAPVDGYYHITGQVRASCSNSNVFGTAIYKNGVQYALGSIIVVGTSFDQSFGVSDLIPLNAGDYVELYFVNGDAGSRTMLGTQTQTWMSGHLVSRT